MEEKCPVCLNKGDRLRTYDYGDKITFDCPRCGGYELTGTAQRLLEREFEEPPVRRPRLSHAIRRRSDRGELPRIASNNLVALFEEPLPTAVEQLRNLIAEISRRAGADAFAMVDFNRTDAEYAAAVIGTTDAQGVFNIIDSAVSDGLLNLTSSPKARDLRSVRITSKGRAELNPAREAPVAPQTTQAGIRRRPAPRWLTSLDDELQALMSEIYQAVEAEMRRLSAMGARTAFDYAMTKLVGDIRGGFAEKLRAMKDQGYISDREIDILGPMIEAGNAAAHRAWNPEPGDLDKILDELEHNLRNWFVRDGDASDVKGSTPPRRLVR